MQKSYFVFTDAKSLPPLRGKNPVQRIQQEAYEWPFSTLRRYEIFLNHESLFEGLDYLFFFNANYLFHDQISPEDILPRRGENIVSAIHPGFFDCNRKLYTYCRDPRSQAYIHQDDGRYYVCGGINGGRTSSFIALMKQARLAIEEDLKHNIIAVWHDESHWNKLIKGRVDVRFLHPGFAYPEDCKTLPYNPLMILRDKSYPAWGGHDYMRLLPDKEESLNSPPRVSLLQRLKRSAFKKCSKIFSIGGSKSRPLKVVEFAGGLGNQLFQYAFYLALKERFPESDVTIDLSHYTTSGTSRTFELSKIYPHLELDFLSDSDPRKPQLIKLSFAELFYSPHIFEAQGSIRYQGYWQSLSYFPRDIDSLRKKLQLPKCDSDAELCEELENTCSVAVHVRRTDYTTGVNSQYYQVCTPEYYWEAMRRVIHKLTNPRFFVFSDDPDWARINFRQEDCTIVSTVDTAGTHRDLQLMSRCKHQIIANSTYSWWAAWLNCDPEKIVIAPETWLNPGLVQTDIEHILPADWLRISLGSDAAALTNAS